MAHSTLALSPDTACKSRPRGLDHICAFSFDIHRRLSRSCRASPIVGQPGGIYGDSDEESEQSDDRIV